MANARLLGRLSLVKFVNVRYSTCPTKIKKGLILGAYTDRENKVQFTSAGEKYNQLSNGELKECVDASGIKKGKAKVFYHKRLTKDYDAVSVVGLGEKGLGFNTADEFEEGKENVRIAAGVGGRSLQELECNKLYLEDLGDAEAAAEGAAMATWIFQEWKNPKKCKIVPEVLPYNISDQKKWSHGMIKANAQNFARWLSDSPSNFMTPTKFSEVAERELKGRGVAVHVRDKEWATAMKMGAFLGVSQGAHEPPRFLEMSYENGKKDQKPYVLLGKGVTFDTGGISLKPSNKMDEMRGDMGGAACVVATLQAVADLKLPINIIGLALLCENMPGSRAIKPGDIVTAMNGKNIKVDNTDAEGRLILADGLSYARSLEPALTIDIATLTGAMRVSLGGAASGVFTNSPALWQEMQAAGATTGDRVWRFPLWKDYSRRLTDYQGADLKNITSDGGGGGSATAAAFLREFAPKENWMHMDIAGVSGPDSKIAYLQSGMMTGRPTRTLIQFFIQKSSSK